MTDRPQERRQLLKASRRARYERMVEIRCVEDKVLELFGEGLVAGTTHTCQGQEAVCVAVAAATRPDDTVACTYRGHGVALALGVPVEAVLGEILGRQCGCMGGLGGSMHLNSRAAGLLPTFAIVGASIPIAAGAALSAQIEGRDSVAISVFGDGAANIGAFHEGINLASIWQLPVVFLCENNSYGEYSRIDRTTPIVDLARRADAYAVPGEIVDGQDVDALEDAIGRAVTRARAGEGPSLIEAKTYRYAGHSRSDKGSYRPPGELERWRERDPILLFGKRLVAEGICDESELQEIEREQSEQVAATVGKVLACEPPTIRQLFEWTTTAKAV